MASSIQILRSTTAEERPYPGQLLEGQPAVNLNAADPGLFFKASDGSLIKLGPAAITTDGLPPNSNPAGFGGNCVGEFWVDASLPTPLFKIFDGTSWLTLDSGSVADGSITNAKLADLAVSSSKLQDEAVITSKISPGAVTTDRLDSNAVNDSVVSSVSASKVSYTADSSTHTRTVASKLNDYANVKDFGAKGNGVDDDTLAIQAALDSSLNVYIPSGNYLVSQGLLIRGSAHIFGDGCREQEAASYTAPIQGTTIFATASINIFETDPNIGPSGHSRILIENLHLQGAPDVDWIVTNPSKMGKNGIHFSNAPNAIINNVRSCVFKESGFYYLGCLCLTMIRCSTHYCYRYGIECEEGGTGTTAANAALILGGRYNINRLGAITTGNSTLGFNIIGVTMESNGVAYSGQGYGVYLTGRTLAVNINNCYFEGNRCNVVIGTDNDNSTYSIPFNTTIEKCYMTSALKSGIWAPTSFSVRINSGRNIVIRDNYPAPASEIFLGPRADGPILSNNGSNFKVLNAAGTVPVLDVGLGSVFPDGAWTSSSCEKTNASVTIDQTQESPDGKSPVYRVQAGSAGPVQLLFTVPAAQLIPGPHYTYGFWFRMQSGRSEIVALRVLSSPPVVSYAEYEVYNFEVTEGWSWLSVGRSVPAGVGNILVGLRINNISAPGDFYLTEMRALEGVINGPFRPDFIGPLVLASPSTNTTSLVSGTITKVNFNQESLDNRNFFSNGTFSPKTPGYYRVSCNLGIGGTVTQANLFLYRNGSQDSQIASVNSPGPVVSGEGILYLNGVSDSVEVRVSLTGSSLNYSASNSSISISRFN